MKRRLDQAMAEKGLVTTRSQAESWIKLGKVTVDGKMVKKPGIFVREEAEILLNTTERYVSRAGLKLASVAQTLSIDFTDTIVLDVGSSTGGFTDFALQHGARLVYAVDVGTEQLHPSLHGHSQIELHEKTDIRDFHPAKTPDIIVIDVSFISLQDIFPAIALMCGKQTIVIAMAKPQFEADRAEVSKGVIKNDTMRRNILKRLEVYMKGAFFILDKSDSEVAGAKGNRERFYKLKRR
ncbi:TlyA family RNA methyltransferase [Pedobacter sp.]|nr:TlyA family RNA methyltransferase [Candidatus Saccharibacteria bacterium]